MLKRRKSRIERQDKRLKRTGRARLARWFDNYNSLKEQAIRHGHRKE